MKIIKIIQVVFICLFSYTSYSQSELENRLRISVGYGLAVIEVSQEDLGGFTVTGPFYIKIAYGFFYNLTFGLNAAYANYHTRREWVDPYSNQLMSNKYKYEAHSLLLRMNYHISELNSKKKFDPYVGIGLGYKQLELTNRDNYAFHYRETGIAGGLETTVGANYFFNKQLAAYVEFGIAKSALQFGITTSF